MRIQLQLRVVADDDSVISDDEILRLDKGDDQVEAIGLSLVEAKAVLAGIQQRVVTAQAASFLARHRCCDRCGRGLLSKGPCRLRFRTASGTIPLVSPRCHRCRCQPAATKTFSPLTWLVTEHTAPERVYLETRWASLMSYGMTADVLQEILPIGSPANASTLRRTVHRVAARHEAELGTEPVSDITGCPTEGPPRPIAQGTVIVGLDGGYVRNWHDKKHNFEVMVGKSLAAGRDDRYFALVRSQDEQPRRRLGAVLQSQGLPGSPTLTLLTDGGDSVRALAAELAPGAVPVLDWFRAT